VGLAWIRYALLLPRGTLATVEEEVKWQWFVRGVHRLSNAFGPTRSWDLRQLAGAREGLYLLFLGTRVRYPATQSWYGIADKR
jgi:hypothetical protein